MRKAIFSVASAVVLLSSLSSCGLFRGGKHEKCPAYSSISEQVDINVAEKPNSDLR